MTQGGQFRMSFDTSQRPSVAVYGGARSHPIQRSRPASV